MPGVKSVLASPWSPQIAARNAAAAQARELQTRAHEEKAAGDPPPRRLSDLEELSKDFHQASVAAREEKPLRGVRIARPLPRSMSERIDTMEGQLGDDLRRARAEGRMRYDVVKGRWLVDGVSAPAGEAKSEGGRFTSSMFRNSATARRQREQGR
jgi:hypothetical protein